MDRRGPTWGIVAVIAVAIIAAGVIVAFALRSNDDSKSSSGDATTTTTKPSAASWFDKTDDSAVCGPLGQLGSTMVDSYKTVLLKVPWEQKQVTLKQQLSSFKGVLTTVSSHADANGQAEIQNLSTAVDTLEKAVESSTTFDQFQVQRKATVTPRVRFAFGALLQKAESCAKT